MLSLWRCQLRHINHAFINISTSILGGRRWHSIWRIGWIPTRYWGSLRLWRCVLWRSVWLLTNRRQLRWIHYQIVQCRRHRYHRWWQLISLWVTVLSIKAPVITRSVLWRSWWLLMNQGQLRFIDDWIIQCRTYRYLRWLERIDISVTVLAIKSPVITRSVLWKSGWLLTNQVHLR